MSKKQLWLASAITGACLLFYALAGCTPETALVDVDPLIRGTELKSNITSNRVLAAGEYTVTTYISVTAALTIQPGVTIYFKPDSGLTIEASGSISALGQADKKIVFQSAKVVAGKGDYSGITIEGNTAVFAYCSFLHANKALYAKARDIKVENCIFETNVEAFDAGYATAVTLKNTQFKNNTVPLWIGAGTCLDDSNGFTGNVYQRIQLWASRITSENANPVVWGETEVPFYIGATTTPGVDTDSHVDIEAGTTLQLNPGVNVVFSAGSGMTVNGVLQAAGTAEKKITFSSGKSTKGKGDWDGIYVNSVPNSTFNYCVFEYAVTALTMHGDGVTGCTVANTAFKLNVTGLDYVSAGIWAPGSGVSYEDNDTDYKAPTTP